MLKERDWEFILQTIKNKKCILLLGPEVGLSIKGKQYEKALTNFLDIGNNDYIISYYKNEGLFLFKDGSSKTQTCFDIEKFLDQEFDDTIFSKLSEIPFHLIISTSPDHNLKKVFDAKKLPYDFEYYDKTTNPRDVNPPSAEKPLLYNLFGSIRKEDSMILTHDDLYDFLLALLGNRNLPQELKFALKEAKNFIFLGFKFEKWYVQLLLRLLNLHNKNLTFDKYAANKDFEDEVTKTMMLDQFGIKFVENEVDKFVNGLYDECSKHDMLRKPENSDISVNELVNKYIEEDELDKAFDLLKDHLEKGEDEDSASELINLKGSYRRHLKKVREGILSESEATIALNKIRKSLKEINDDVKMLG